MAREVPKRPCHHAWVLWDYASPTTRLRRQSQPLSPILGLQIALIKFIWLVACIATSASEIFSPFSTSHQSVSPHRIQVARTGALRFETTPHQHVPR
ncbi:MAG TPA: hypothetical protein PKG49_12065 [Nitrosomonas mobilis]|nr:hypothetical protein [Nitrosomonas mobilis]